MTSFTTLTPAGSTTTQAYSPDQIAALALGAGLSQSAAITATAISMAENANGVVNEKGDLSLENVEWGPSYGLWQIRTEKNPTNAERDISKLQTPQQQAAAMALISNQGQSWSAWSTYINGDYFAKLPAATAAVAKALAGGATVGTPATAASFSSDINSLNPLNGVTSEAQNAYSALQSIGDFFNNISDLQKDQVYVIRGAKVVVGMVLVVVALGILNRDLIGNAVGEVAKVAPEAALAA